VWVCFGIGAKIGCYCWTTWIPSFFGAERNYRKTWTNPKKHPPDILSCGMGISCLLVISLCQVRYPVKSQVVKPEPEDLLGFWRPRSAAERQVISRNRWGPKVSSRRWKMMENAAVTCRDPGNPEFWYENVAVIKLGHTFRPQDIGVSYWSFGIWSFPLDLVYGFAFFKEICRDSTMFWPLRCTIWLFNIAMGTHL
jgi:hypothetical protein